MDLCTADRMSARFIGPPINCPPDFKAVATSIVQIMQIKFKIREQLFFVDLFHKFNFTPLVLIYRVPAQQLLLNLNLYWNYPKTRLIAKNDQDE